jgi:hypothetical protein
MRPPASRLTALLSLVALAAGLSLIAGCYTALRHPGALDLTQEPEYQDKSCYDCHDESSFYHSYYGVYFDYYYDSPWFGYYSDPWWYSSRWYGGHAGSANREGRDSYDRNEWKRGTPPSGSTRGSSGLPSAPSYLREDYSQKSSGGGSNQPEKTPEKKKEEDSTKRTTGSRGKKK